MGSYRIAVIGGDGIGPEVTHQAISVLKALAPHYNLHLEYEEFPWGAHYYLRHGRMMAEDALDVLRHFDAILFGAVGNPQVPEPVAVSGLLLPIRRAYDLYVNLRPNILHPGVSSPLRDAKPGDIDLVVVRENTEGEYAPVGGHLFSGTPDEVVVQSGVFTRRGTERVMRYAFELARQRPRKHVTSITKSNAQGFSMAFWDRVFQEVSEDYHDVETSEVLVDAAAMDMVRRPQRFDVVVASNLFGDILTDLAAAVTGGIGLAASGNLNPEKRYPSVFEPIHGSAPDIAGKGVANPLAAILSAAMMLDHLGEAGAASSVRKAVNAVLTKGKALTPDLGGKASTSEVTDAVIAAL